MSFGYGPAVDKQETIALLRAAAYLLGPEAGFITGSDLLIDGGVIAALSVQLTGEQITYLEEPYVPHVVRGHR